MEKPFELEITYVVRINNLEAFVKDIKAAVMQIQSLPSDIALRSAASKVFEDALNNAITKVNGSNVSSAEETHADTSTDTDNEEEDKDHWYDYGDEN